MYINICDKPDATHSFVMSILINIKPTKIHFVTCFQQQFNMLYNAIALIAVLI